MTGNTASKNREATKHEARMATLDDGNKDRMKQVSREEQQQEQEQQQQQQQQEQRKRF